MKKVFMHIPLLILMYACSTIDTGFIVWATSANLSIAMTNSGAVAHAASQEALRELSAKLDK